MGAVRAVNSGVLHCQFKETVELEGSGVRDGTSRYVRVLVCIMEASLVIVL